MLPVSTSYRAPAFAMIVRAGAGLSRARVLSGRSVPAATVLYSCSGVAVVPNFFSDHASCPPNRQTTPPCPLSAELCQTKLQIYS
jgi:hypothetical protein